ncbi:hypothetical protein NDU88_005790 [Pleurodeles waltl]|uniref:Uncharacterized protein n=1 Tax=Pleurodeles waltl TaxID=8319 RepID=A0AAV7RM26_PLEWA|nr:hypothetical protein NDU88_005790 [Pleurodeles waltl]
MSVRTISSREHQWSTFPEGEAKDVRREEQEEKTGEIKEGKGGTGNQERKEQGREEDEVRFGARFRVPNPFCLGRVWRLERGRVAVVRR